MVNYFEYNAEDRLLTMQVKVDKGDYFDEESVVRENVSILEIDGFTYYFYLQNKFVDDLRVFTAEMEPFGAAKAAMLFRIFKSRKPILHVDARGEWINENNPEAQRTWLESLKTLETEIAQRLKQRIASTQAEEYLR